MKERLRAAAKRAAENPVLRKSARSMKPGTGIWGVMGVFVFFIIPEIIGFIYGGEISSWAHAKSVHEPVETLALSYRLLEMLFEDGGSWVNLFIGMLLLGWIAVERRRVK